MLAKESKKSKANINVAATASANDIALEEKGESGSIQISNNVVAAIVKKYAMEIPGVVRLAPQGLVGDIADMLSQRNYDRNISIEFGDNGEAEISLMLVLEFGIPLVNICKQIQETVRTHVEELTGVKVTKVNVIVKELEEKAEEEAAEEVLTEEV